MSRAARPGITFATLATAAFALLGAAVGASRLSDNSFLTHLVTGHRILDQGFPRSDHLSFTATGSPWVLQSWLAEVGYAVLDRTVGGVGLRAFGAVVGAATATATFRLALHLARDVPRAVAISAAALAGPFALWAERPFVLGLLALVVLAWVVEVPDGRLGRHPVVVLPVLGWLWANVHGSFALGAAYLGLHLVGRWLDGHPPWTDRERALVLGGALAAAVILVNPYGPALLTFPLDLVTRGDALRDVVEWRSPDFRTVRGQVFLVWVAVYVAALARPRTPVSRRDLVVSLPFLLLGFWALRNVAVAPLLGLPVVARAWAVPVPGRAGAPVRLVGWAGVALLAAAAVVGAATVATEAPFDRSTYPVAALTTLERRGLVGANLLLDDADAAYAEHRFPDGRQPVFLDDRVDMFPIRVIADYTRIAQGRPGWDRLLARHDVETVVWAADGALAERLARSGAWVRIHRDPRWVAFVRSDLADT